METLTEYVTRTTPNIVKEHIRATTPFYYEPNVIYHPISNGMGCGANGSNERFVIKNGTYTRNGDIQMSLVSLDKPNHKCCILKSEAHLSIARVEETTPIGKEIPNDRKIKYMTIDGRDYRITQLSWRNYQDNTLCGKIWVRCEQDIPSIVWGEKRYPYHELYSNFGSSWNHKHVKSYDSVAREQYDIKMGVSMRYFKEKVFGDANIKIKCQLFGDK